MKLWLEAMAVQVVKQRENGSGVIEIPVLIETSGSDFEVDGAMLREIESNFIEFPVVPIGVSPHQEFEERGGFSQGFIESVEVRGDQLFAQIDISAELFAQVVELGGWRGFSVEMMRDFKSQAKNIPGWVLTGGVFTNRPAVNAHFKVAAEASQSCSQQVFSIVPIRGAEVQEMSEKQNAPQSVQNESVSLEFHKSELGNVRQQITALEAVNAELKSRAAVSSDSAKQLRSELALASDISTGAEGDLIGERAKVTKLEADNRGLRDASSALRSTLNELQSKLDKAESKNLSEKVLAIRNTALEAGVPPAVFEGLDENPEGWFKASYASLEAFEKQMHTLGGCSRDLVSTNVRSSNDSASKRSSDETQLSAGVLERLDRMGLGSKYANVTHEGQLKKLPKSN